MAFGFLYLNDWEIAYGQDINIALVFRERLEGYASREEDEVYKTMSIEGFASPTQAAGKRSQLSQGIYHIFFTPFDLTIKKNLRFSSRNTAGSRL